MFDDNCDIRRQLEHFEYEMNRTLAKGSCIKDQEKMLIVKVHSISSQELLKYILVVLDLVYYIYKGRRYKTRNTFLIFLADIL